MRVYRQVFLSGVVASVVLASSPLLAQDIEFADDFSTDPTALSAGSFDNSSGDWSITSATDGWRMQVGSDDPSRPGSAYIMPRDTSDSVGIDFTFSAESSHTGSSTVFLESRVFSEIATPDERNDDIEMQMTFDRDNSGNFTVFYCLQRQLDGFEEPIGEFGSEFCTDLVSGIGADGVRHSMDISVDRDAGSVTVSFDDVSRTITSPVPVFPPASSSQRIQLWLNTGNLGNAVATLHEIRQVDSSIALAGTPTTFDRYFPLNDLDGDQRTASHANGVLTLTAEATEENDDSNRLYLREPTDYFETTFTLSSASDVSAEANARVRGEIETSLYNDLGDGGVDGRAGDVEALMEAQLRGNGQAALYYCLYRTEDTEGEERVGLLPDGERCDTLPLSFGFDTPIRMSIDLNRELGTVALRANEVGETISLGGPMFSHSDPFAVVRTTSRDLGSAVLDIDEIRTSSSALTESESSSGAATPTPFPPLQTEAPLADSSIAFPYSETAPLDFVDDFSSDTSLLSFDPNEDRTDAGIAFIDGALQIEAALTDSDDCCGDGQLRIQESTDFIAARVSLLSDSRLPVDRDARALVRIEGTWYNDTQDGGFNDRGGDVYVQMRIYARGDGQREAQFCFDRQTGSGDNEPLSVVDGQNCGEFDTVPEFDTEYDMSVALDRAAQTMTFTFDSETRTVDLGGTVFQESRSEKAINVQHEGASGRAVGRIHSLTTDSGTIDIAADMPLIGPYRPHYSTQNAGRDVFVEDGRLRIEVDSSVTEDNQPRFVSENPSEYVSAVLEISSESALADGFVNMDVGGHMYNDIMAGGVGDNRNNEGAVYGLTRMVISADGEDYIEYCAFRSNNSDFSDATELLGDDGETCPRFTAVPALDTPVQLVVAIDRSRGVLQFAAGEETAEYTIATGIFTPHNYFNGVRVRAGGGSRLVGYADDLAYSENPVVLADSTALVGFVADTGSESEGSDSESGGGSSGGGGCSIATGSGGLGAPVLMLLGLFAPILRRRARRLVSKGSKASTLH